MEYWSQAWIFTYLTTWKRRLNEKQLCKCNKTLLQTISNFYHVNGILLPCLDIQCNWEREVVDVTRQKDSFLSLSYKKKTKFKVIHVIFIWTFKIISVFVKQMHMMCTLCSCKFTNLNWSHLFTLPILEYKEQYSLIHKHFFYSVGMYGTVCVCIFVCVCKNVSICAMWSHILDFKVSLHCFYKMCMKCKPHLYILCSNIVSHLKNCHNHV